MAESFPIETELVLKADYKNFIVHCKKLSKFIHDLLFFVLFGVTTW